MKNFFLKQSLNVIMLINKTTSMKEKYSVELDTLLNNTKKYIEYLQKEKINDLFNISLIDINLNENNYCIEAKNKNEEQSNYMKVLGKILSPKSKGGIMPDFGGIPPVLILLVSDKNYKILDKDLDYLMSNSWFNAALRYGISIELKDERIINELRKFVGNNGDVIYCYDVILLDKIIKIIVNSLNNVKLSEIEKITEMDKGKASNNQTAQTRITEALFNLENWSDDYVLLQ